jgi:hypothetical protein
LEKELPVKRQKTAQGWVLRRSMGRPVEKRREEAGGGKRREEAGGGEDEDDEDDEEDEDEDGDDEEDEDEEEDEDDEDDDDQDDDDDDDDDEEVVVDEARGAGGGQEGFRQQQMPAHHSAGGGSRGAATRGAQIPRWRCDGVECGALNKHTRTVCQNCGADRPTMDVSTPRGEGGLSALVDAARRRSTTTQGDMGEGIGGGMGGGGGSGSGSSSGSSSSGSGSSSSSSSGGDGDVTNSTMSASSQESASKDVPEVTNNSSAGGSAGGMHNGSGGMNNGSGGMNNGSASAGANGSSAGASASYSSASSSSADAKKPENVSPVEWDEELARKEAVERSRKAAIIARAEVRKKRELQQRIMKRKAEMNIDSAAKEEENQKRSNHRSWAKLQVDTWTGGSNHYMRGTQQLCYLLNNMCMLPSAVRELLPAEFPSPRCTRQDERYLTKCKRTLLVRLHPDKMRKHVDSNGQINLGLQVLAEEIVKTINTISQYPDE